MSDEAFGNYAAKLEREDFEDDIRSLNASLYQLVAAREDTIKKLRESADYLDSIWFRCKVSRSVGTSASVVGGSLTIAGGILTLTTAGAAAPLLIAGIATSSVGAATNIGTSLIERIINSKQIKGNVVVAHVQLAFVEYTFFKDMTVVYIFGEMQLFVYNLYSLTPDKLDIGHVANHRHDWSFVR